MQLARSLSKSGCRRSAQDLGIIVEAPPESAACTSTNRFVIGGVGDVSAMLSPNRQDLFLFLSQYSKTPSDQGVALGRLTWADRDNPVGRVSVWRDGVWMLPRPVVDADGGITWSYPIGTPLSPPSKPWHDGHVAADAFWGPSIHWNRYLERRHGGNLDPCLLLRPHLIRESHSTGPLPCVYDPQFDHTGEVRGPTHPAFVATRSYDFAAERARTRTYGRRLNAGHDDLGVRAPSAGPRDR